MMSKNGELLCFAVTAKEYEDRFRFWDGEEATPSAVAYRMETALANRRVHQYSIINSTNVYMMVSKNVQLD